MDTGVIIAIVLILFVVIVVGVAIPFFSFRAKKALSIRDKPNRNAFPVMYTNVPSN